MNAQNKNKYIFIISKYALGLAFFAVFGIIYRTINNSHIGSSGAILESAIDRAIPFKLGWIWFYYSYFFIFIFPIALVENWRELFKGLLSFFIAAVLTMIIHLFWITEMIRPEIVGDSLSANMLRFIHSLDAPYSCFPSQHVAYSFISAFISFRKNRGVGIFVFILACLISISTLFIKQHWFWDIPSGILVALVSFYCVHLPKKKSL